MTEPTQTQPPTDTPSAYGWCAWHQGHAHGVRLIEVQEQASGPGGNVFACRPCREAYDLVPFADRP
ncbi:hypothetical protein [Streptomyces sp. PSKA30]|uniref:hypothetical protein n=1 Tax=Streptomyces sp. PSKA30 TaxID=2874597 RepID=UPI001CD174F1|nr:hypothetical protein [Streptomyces sp. PSKA30]MBZ9638015.1 hypothetical protein [Streptomyces sp. PSKA30]